MATLKVSHHRSWIWLSTVVACAVALISTMRGAKLTELSTSVNTQSTPPSLSLESPTPAEALPTDPDRQRDPTLQVATASAQPAEPAQGAPVVEPPEVIASMDLEFIREEVDRMDRELEQRNAIARLNSEDLSQSERLELGALIQRAALFRHRLLEVAVEALALDVDRYGKTHEARVAELRKNSIRR